ncbi:DUF3854 domain-containing protein [Thermanaeromonas sp. C210]|uniref:DUF3854 domain-containing protein n=1 Tax=Thermanaeromonas sp. C210 TaxID=2731925 RepID=UPI0020B6C685|nr:DUF3854 domain-containing protein [Thermanaeromonas sp. C210]
MVIAYDMDYKSNKTVATAKRMLAAELSKMGITVRETVWEARSKEEKGIDNALVARLELTTILTT